MLSNSRVFPSAILVFRVSINDRVGVTFRYCERGQRGENIIFHMPVIVLCTLKHIHGAIAPILYWYAVIGKMIAIVS